MSDNMRVMRVVLSAEQIRRMDRLILAGAGGIGNRNEFISEAIESLVLDLSFPEAEPEPAVIQSHALPDLPEAPIGLNVVAQDWGFSVATPAEADSEPLFGLHNRDYPSIWALWRLSIAAHDGPVPLNSTLSALSDEAWHAGQQLKSLELESPGTITSLFPTNPGKRDSAESAFREFAIGAVAFTAGKLAASGPLFEWGVCVAEGSERDASICLTEAGWELLSQLDGLGPVQPHSQEHAEVFLAHLERHAPADWRCFVLVMAMCDRDNPTRSDVVEAFKAHLGLTGDSAASTYAAGYVARCREWGLLEPKQVKGTYMLADFGRSILRRRENGDG